MENLAPHGFVVVFVVAHNSLVFSLVSPQITRIHTDLFFYHRLNIKSV